MTYLEEYEKAYKETFLKLQEIIINAIKDTEKQMGRELTMKEKEIIVNVAVPFVFLRAIIKSNNKEPKNEQQTNSNSIDNHSSNSSNYSNDGPKDQ